MKKILFILLFNTCFFFISYAQTSGMDSLIYLNGFNWKMGDKKLSRSELRREISKYPAAVPYLKKGNTNAILSKVFFAGAAFFSLGSILTYEQPYIYLRNGRGRLSKNLIVASSFIAGAITFKFSLRNKGKAVHLRNLEVLKRQ